MTRSWRQRTKRSCEASDSSSKSSAQRSFWISRQRYRLSWPPLRRPGADYFSSILIIWSRRGLARQSLSTCHHPGISSCLSLAGVLFRLSVCGRPLLNLAGLQAAASLEPQLVCTYVVLHTIAPPSILSALIGDRIVATCQLFGVLIYMRKAQLLWDSSPTTRITLQRIYAFIFDEQYTAFHHLRR